jgi:hypothetical protein
VTPTRLPVLVALAVLTAVLGSFAINLQTGELLSLPLLAPGVGTLMALFELVLAKVVRDRLRGRSRGRRQMHPFQIARAAVLAKASSTTGALLTGLYAGLWLWFFQHDELRVAADNAVVAALSVGASVLLVLAALVLERMCRTPDLPSE